MNIYRKYIGILLGYFGVDYLEKLLTYNGDNYFDLSIGAKIVTRRTIKNMVSGSNSINNDILDYLCHRLNIKYDDDERWFRQLLKIADDLLEAYYKKDMLTIKRIELQIINYKRKECILLAEYCSLILAFTRYCLANDLTFYQKYTDVGLSEKILAPNMLKLYNILNNQIPNRNNRIKDK